MGSPSMSILKASKSKICFCFCVAVPKIKDWVLSTFRFNLLFLKYYDISFNILISATILGSSISLQLMLKVYRQQSNQIDKFLHKNVISLV